MREIDASPISTTIIDPRHLHRPRIWNKAEPSASCRPVLAAPPPRRPRSSGLRRALTSGLPWSVSLHALDGEVFASTASFSSRTARSSNSFAYRSSISLSETWSTSPDRRLARRARSLRESTCFSSFSLDLAIHRQTLPAGDRCALSAAAERPAGRCDACTSQNLTNARSADRRFQTCRCRC